MTSTELNLLAPLDSPLPSPPEGEVLTTSQWITLMAIADTIIPSVVVSSVPSPNKLSIPASTYATAISKLTTTIPTAEAADTAHKYLQENASSTPGFKETLHRQLGHYVRQDALKGIIFILSTLDTRAGCLLTTGYTTSFHLQPVQIRQQILHNWEKSYLPPLNQSARALQAMVTAAWTKKSAALGPVLGFPRIPVHGKPGKGFDYSFIQFPPGTEPAVIETDVVIVGSGCGGGVCAKNIAVESGHRVIVVEKAYHYPPEYLPMSKSDADVHLFMNGGVDVSDDSSIAVLAGQAWGGGGTVNWSASLQTQAFVRKEWADGGLPFFTSSEFQDSLDRVCHRMGVSAAHVEHNPTNEVLLEGSRRLGYSAKPVPQNTAGKKHYCGYCTLGCGAAEKQGPVVSFLPDAERAGAKFIEGFQADKVTFENRKGAKVATGVEGLWRSRDSHGGVNGTDHIVRQVYIKAKRVIVSAGTLQSPLLLLRSGLSNPQIGRNLHLHPVALIAATFPQETRPWEGGILTSVCDEFQNLDGHGHGTKIEAMTMIPGWILPFLRWTGGLDYKMLCSKANHMTGHISLVRDRDSGRVYPDPVDGRLRMAYTPSAFDARHALEGVLAAAKILYVSGAAEIIFTTAGIPTFVRDNNIPDAGEGVNDAKFQAWLELVRRKGANAPDTVYGSAHQMGTCRMGNKERTSVVDPTGKVWGTEGLYVADASVFPSASGVNPMVTNMAISDWISRGIAKGLRKESRVEEGARL